MPYSAPESDTPAAEKAREKRFKVDLWATDFNDVELGIMKRTQHEAASDQFTKDMEVIGQVKEDGERTGLIAYRKGLWNEERGGKRRLVIKLFSDNWNWRGSLDMMVGRSLQLAHGADGIPAPAFSINLARHDQLVQLESSAHRLPLVPEKFSFFILTEDGPVFYRLRRDRVSIGADFNLFGPDGKKVGRLDGKVVNLGGAWKVRLAGSHANAKLESVLTLFCAMLRFHDGCRKHVETLQKAMADGRAIHLDHHEDDLYMNPRRAR